MLCCLHPDCKNLPERNGYCSTHNRELRRIEKEFSKPKKIYKPIKKVSAKRASELTEYSKQKAKFLLGKWCAFHGKPCIPTDLHHAAGKIGFIDELAREKGITAFMDIRYWIPLCRAAHQEVEANPNWAKENGLSESRLSKK
ncbi:MAG: hypothetical protein ABUL44_04110 [Flavobacterium sp.]